MIKIKLDFETFCDLDISLVGAHKYVDHPSFRILCLGYKIDDGPAQIWVPGDTLLPFMKEWKDGYLFYAFGATFDYLVWSEKGVPNYGFTPIPLSAVRDARALSTRFRMPADLLKSAVALGCKNLKMASGKALIKKCCTPAGNASYDDFMKLYEYCRQDIETLDEILYRLPADEFLPSEQRLWELTYLMNKRGVPVDIKEVESIVHYLAVYMDQMKHVLPDITDGFIQTPGQIAKIKAFCKKKGVELPDVTADTVEKFLNKEDLPEEVRGVLEVRQLLGRSSVKKFITIKEMENKGVVQGNLAFHKSGTGRWAGQGFQYHNLPRAKVEDPDMWIEKFVNREPIDNPVKTAQALIRPMIKAPEGYSLLVGDYSSIENRILPWMCDDFDTLAAFVGGVDLYKDMASFLFGIPYDDIDDLQRFIGKQIILGCGYMMGYKRFRAEVASRGVVLSDQQALEAVIAYRNKYPLVKNMWEGLSNTCKEVVGIPGKVIENYKCKFQVVTDKVSRKWLRITLPSGRSMMYADPRLGEGSYGVVVKYRGLNSKTFQMEDIALTPGLITENIDQGIARDILASGMVAVEDNMPELSLSISVHDEAGGLIKDSDITDETIPTFERLMCTIQPWMKGIPLAMSSYIAKRYRKD